MAHLLRKARGLSESLEPEAQVFGEKTLEFMAEFIKGIYQAREGPGILPKEEFAEQLTELKSWCEKHRDSTHEKTRQLARELLNDWDVIWTVLEHPELPSPTMLLRVPCGTGLLPAKLVMGREQNKGVEPSHFWLA